MRVNAEGGLLQQEEYCRKYRGENGIKYIAAQIRKAIREKPVRLFHGYVDERGIPRDTSWTGFWIIAGSPEIYDYRDLHLIPKWQRILAWSVHSHSSSYVGNKLERFQPINAGDIHVWLTLVKKGNSGDKTILIMKDGRMEVLELTEDTDRRIFNFGLGTLKKKLLIPFDEQRVDIPIEEQERQLLREFAYEYGLNYYEDRSWM